VSEVFLCETGQLSAASKRDLKKAGIVVVEVEDPSRCQFIRATETISADDMLWAAIDALRVESGNYGRDNRERLAHNLWVIVTDARNKRLGIAGGPS
jgi:hypothetical protein